MRRDGTVSAEGRKSDLVRAVVLLAAVVLQTVAGAIGGSGAWGEPVGSVANSYPTLVLPGGGAFSIWTLIYVLSIALAVRAALPGQRRMVARRGRVRCGEYRCGSGDHATSFRGRVSRGAGGPRYRDSRCVRHGAALRGPRVRCHRRVGSGVDRRRDSVVAGGRGGDRGRAVRAARGCSVVLACGEPCSGGLGLSVGPGRFSVTVVSEALSVRRRPARYPTCCAGGSDALGVSSHRH